jgi:hypothetical protein
MGKYGEEPNFVDFNNYSITQEAPVPLALVRNITRGYMYVGLIWKTIGCDGRV